MAVRINSRLNLVIPLYRDTDAEYAWVYSMPISEDVFTANYLLLSMAFAQMHRAGLGELGAQRVTLMMMRDIAENKIGGDDGVQRYAALLAEFRRLSTAVVMSDAGWQPVPFQVAVDRKMIDAEDVSAVENAIAFFMCHYAMLDPRRFRDIVPGMVQMWGAQTTSSPLTEWIASLQTSTTGAASAPQTAPPVGLVTTTTVEGGVSVSSLPS